MRIISWNLRRASSESRAWEILEELKGDVIFLQEVTNIPKNFQAGFHIVSAIPRTQTGTEQKFSTVVLSKTTLGINSILKSKIKWVNEQLDFYTGNLLSCSTVSSSGLRINLVCVYSPAWPIPNERLKGIDISSVKLKQNDKIYCTEILWACLKEAVIKDSDAWVIAGDFNSSLTFDWKRPRGNQEIIDRMNSLGFVDSLSSSEGRLVPTFINNRGGKIIHQLDYIYLNEILKADLRKSYVISSPETLNRSISDHLPVITELK